MSSVVTVDQRVQSQWDMLKLHFAEMCRPESNIARHPSMVSSSQPCQVNLSVKQEMSLKLASIGTGTLRERKRKGSESGESSQAETKAWHDLP